MSSTERNHDPGAAGAPRDPWRHIITRDPVSVPTLLGHARVHISASHDRRVPYVVPATSVAGGDTACRRRHPAWRVLAAAPTHVCRVFQENNCLIAYYHALSGNHSDRAALCAFAQLRAVREAEQRTAAPPGYRARLYPFKTDTPPPGAQVPDAVASSTLKSADVKQALVYPIWVVAHIPIVGARVL